MSDDFQEISRDSAISDCYGSTRRWTSSLAFSPPSMATASSGPQRTSSVAHRSSKPYLRPQKTPAREKSGFLHSIKSISSTAFGWLVGQGARDEAGAAVQDARERPNLSTSASGTTKRPIRNAEQEGSRLTKRPRRSSPSPPRYVDPTRKPLPRSPSIPTRTTMSPVLRSSSVRNTNQAGQQRGGRLFGEVNPRGVFPSSTRKEAVDKTSWKNEMLEPVPGPRFTFRATPPTNFIALTPRPNVNAALTELQNSAFPSRSPFRRTTDGASYVPKPVQRSNSVFATEPFKSTPRPSPFTHRERPSISPFPDVHMRSPTRANAMDDRTPFRVPPSLRSPVKEGSVGLFSRDGSVMCVDAGSPERLQPRVLVDQFERRLSSIPPPLVSTENILATLEQAQPWSESRKLRREQREKITIPLPSTEGRTERMIRPYGRRVREPVVAETQKKGLLGRLMAMKKCAESDQKKELRVESDSSTAHALEPEPKKDVPADDLQLTQEDTLPSAKEPKSSSAMSIVTEPESSIVSSSNSKDAPLSSLPFSLTPSSSFKRLEGTVTPPSSLRAPRSSQKPHERPISIRRKRPNRFSADDSNGADDDDNDREDGALDTDELNKWASKGSIPLEIPLGWKFEAAAESDSRSTSQVKTNDAPVLSSYPPLQRSSSGAALKLPTSSSSQAPIATVAEPSVLPTAPPPTWKGLAGREETGPAKTENVTSQENAKPAMTVPDPAIAHVQGSQSSTSNATSLPNKAANGPSLSFIPTTSLTSDTAKATAQPSFSFTPSPFSTSFPVKQTSSSDSNVSGPQSFPMLGEKPSTLISGDSNLGKEPSIPDNDKTSTGSETKQTPDGSQSQGQNPVISGFTPSKSSSLFGGSTGFSFESVSGETKLSPPFVFGNREQNAPTATAPSSLPSSSTMPKFTFGVPAASSTTPFSFNLGTTTPATPVPAVKPKTPPPTFPQANDTAMETSPSYSLPVTTSTAPTSAPAPFTFGSSLSSSPSLFKTFDTPTKTNPFAKPGGSLPSAQFGMTSSSTTGFGSAVDPTPGSPFAKPTVLINGGPFGGNPVGTPTPTHLQIPNVDTSVLSPTTQFFIDQSNAAPSGSQPLPFGFTFSASPSGADPTSPSPFVFGSPVGVSPQPPSNAFVFGSNPSTPATDPQSPIPPTPGGKRMIKGLPGRRAAGRKP